MAVSLSNEQLAAIGAPTSVWLRAGAGSGKTEALARRFVALLTGETGQPALSPEQVVAITFTERTALDMRRRIEQVLAERLKAAAAGQLARLLRQARRTLTLARISTLHSFCSRLVRENATTLGLDPGFTVLDEGETRTLIERRLERFLVEGARVGDPDVVTLVQMYGLAGSRGRPGAVGRLAQLLEEADRFGLEAAEVLALTRQSAVPEAARASLTTLLVSLRDCIEGTLEIEASEAGLGEPLSALRSRWPALREQLERLAELEPPPALRLLRELSDLMPSRRRPYQVMLDRVRLLVRPAKRRIGLAGCLVELYGDLAACRPRLALAETLFRFSHQLESYKRERAVLTFDDLQLYARRLLRRPELSRHYRQSIGALLIDECQDLDSVQHAIVQLLTDPEPPPAPSLFMVGDEKQSIYGFRGADISLYLQSRRPQLAELPLSENRRSTPAIIAFVNALGAHLMPAEAPGGAGAVRWEQGRLLKPVRPEGPDPAVELLLLPKPPQRRGRLAAACDCEAAQALAMTRREQEAAALARRIAELVAFGATVTDPSDGTARAARFGDIAVLMRAFKDVVLYERALRAADIPYYTVRGEGFFACPEILDIASLLSALDNPEDELSLAAALRSPLFGLSDQTLLELALHEGRPHGRAGAGFARLLFGPRQDFHWLSQQADEAAQAQAALHDLRGWRERRPLAAVIERALELTSLEAVLAGLPDGAQRVANLGKLIDLARRFEATDSLEFADFASVLRRLVEEPPRQGPAPIVGEQDDVVRLMTIHQAKGLEFPVVAVADLGRRLPAESQGSLLSRNEGVISCASVGTARDELAAGRASAELAARSAAAQAEAARLLYVAVTRARDRLILSEGAYAEGWAAELRALIGTAVVERFLASGAAEERVAAGARAIVLRRAQVVDRPAASARPPDKESAAAQATLPALLQRRLAARPAPASELLTSPSALADFERCPRQYQYRHLYQLAEQSAGAAAGKPAVELGLIAHRVLERLADGPLAGDLTSQVVHLVDAAACDTALDPQQRAEMVEDLARYARQAFAAEGTRVRQAQPVLRREVPFFLTVGDRQTTLFVRGRIDLIVERDAEVIVRDYKYALGGQANDETAMHCYALAAAEAYPDRPVRAAFVFLRQGPRMVELELPEPAAIRARLLELARGMLNAAASGRYPRRPTHRAQCYALRCGYIERCWSGPQTTAAAALQPPPTGASSRP